MALLSVRAVSVAMLAKAQRNKVFRAGWHGALGYVAIDGWMLFCSRHRHCPECLVGRVRIKTQDGSIEEFDEYYRRYAVAMLIDERFDLAVAFEPLPPKDLRPPRPRGRAKTTRLIKADEDEGELTAATRLIKRVHEAFGWIDVVVTDALSANGPFPTATERLGPPRPRPGLPKALKVQTRPSAMRSPCPRGREGARARAALEDVRCVR